MSYQEKKSVVSIISGIVILIAYCLYAFNKVQSGVAASDDIKFWATTILIFIGIGIVATIIIQIVFHILLSIGIAIKKEIQHEKYDDKAIEKTLALEMVADEMDKLIELKSIRIGFIISGFGFIAALVSLVMDYSPAVMINILFFSFSIGSMIEGIAQLYFYKRGVRNG